MFKETPLTLSPRIPTAPVALERMLNTVAANAPKIVLIDVEDDAWKKVNFFQSPFIQHGPTSQTSVTRWIELNN